MDKKRYERDSGTFFFFASNDVNFNFGYIFLLNKFILPYDIYNIFIDILKDKKNLTFKKGNSIFIIIDKKKI